MKGEAAIFNQMWASAEKEADELLEALKEMVAAHSMANIGLGASKRRLEAIKKARAAIAKATDEKG